MQSHVIMGSETTIEPWDVREFKMTLENVPRPPEETLGSHLLSLEKITVGG